MAYNLTNLTSAKTIVDIGDYANQVTNDLFGNSLVIALFIILVFRLKKYDMDDAVPAASFVMFILSFFLWFMGWCTWYMPAGFLIMAALSTLFLYASKRS
jgi:hypothetical protein